MPSIETVSFSERERAALCELFDRVGPDHPTLCKGWDTYDLAAHLYVRESDPMAGPGLVISALNETTEKRMTQAKQRWSYPDLVDKVRNGPPTLSIFSMPVLGKGLNAVEYFVHHEDVRRAAPGWEPRDLPGADQDELWKRLGLPARGLVRDAPDGVILSRPDGTATTAKKGEPVVTVTGEPAELTMWAFRRDSAPKVTFTGDPAAIARLTGSDA